MAKLERAPRRMEIDGVESKAQIAGEVLIFSETLR